MISRRPVIAAAAGACCIASSAVLMRLAGSSPSMTAFGRCGLALPLLAPLAWLEYRRTGERMTARAKWLARVAGMLLSCDLILWSHSIADIGAGLGTVVTNLQVIIVALLAWWLLGERPNRSLLAALPAMLTGLVLVGGLVGSKAYGSHPGLGVAFGMGVAVFYSGFILMLRQATSGLVPVPDPGVPGGGLAGGGLAGAGVAGAGVAGGGVAGAGVASGGGGLEPAAHRRLVAAPLFEATIGATFGALVIGLALRDFRLGPAWPALGWLALLALTSQVIGWLLITVSMSRLPAWLVGAVLLVQPAGAVALGAVIFGERPAPAQLFGVGLMLVGVLVAASGRGPGEPTAAADPPNAPSTTARAGTAAALGTTGRATSAAGASGTAGGTDRDVTPVT